MLKSRTPNSGVEEKSPGRQNTQSRRGAHDGTQQVCVTGRNNVRRQQHSDFRSFVPAAQVPVDVPRQHRRFQGQNQRQYKHHTPVYHQNPTVTPSKPENESTTLPAPRHIPGMIYDPVKKKHFRIASEHSGVSGFTSSDIAHAKRERERISALSANRPRVASGSFALRPVVHPITSMANALSLGRSSARFDRCMPEARLLNANPVPNAILEHPLSSCMTVMGCQFLEVAPDGRSVFGCWSASEDGVHSRGGFSSYILSMDAVIDDEAREKALIEEDKKSPCSVRIPHNTMGLALKSRNGAYSETADPQLVDICVGAVDTDVTCCLYVSASSRMTSSGIRTRCGVNFVPVVDWCNPESTETLGSPIYNTNWNVDSSVWSCAWSGNTMRIALGLEDCARISDVVSDQRFVISSKKRNVISQEFSPEGNLLYMGLRADDVIRSDLRMSSQHLTGSFKGSKNAGWIHVLKSSHPNCVLTETFNGVLSLWDERRSDKPLMTFAGHCNSHYRLPCHVDLDERFVFAVGEDGCTRGWSLTSGDLLCAVPSPRPIEARADFPRVVYSDRWGGRAGNAALLLAVGNSCRLHQLDL